MSDEKTRASAALTATANAQTAYARARALNLAVAREDPAMFVRMVLKDDRTGKPIEQGPLHDGWHEMISDHARVVLWAHIEAGKTQQISIGRVLYELGRNPNLHVAIVSNTSEQAKKIVRSLAQYIEKNEDLHAVFPELRKTSDRSAQWSSSALTVERSTFSKDPSIQACGVHGNITGARVDLLILDDILDYENTRTAAQRDDLWAWIQSTPFGRLTEDSRVVVVGNAWHPDDCMYRMAAIPRFVSKRYPVVDEKDRLTWPARWSRRRIEQARQDLGPLEAARQLLCLARDDAESRFKREWIDVGLKAGKNYETLRRIETLPDGYSCFTGVDLAVQARESSHKTVFFTILVWPNGTRQVLSIDAGKWSGPEILERADAIYDRYGGILMVENVAAQDYLLQFAKKMSRAVIRPFTTGRNKANPEFGVETLAAEMAAGKWVIPNKLDRAGKRVIEPEIEAWIQEMLYYNPKDHTGDRLMASWFAREAARAYERRSAGPRTVGIRVIGGDKASTDRREMETAEAAVVERSGLRVIRGGLG